jgi:hypothetical protein
VGTTVSKGGATFIRTWSTPCLIHFTDSKEPKQATGTTFKYVGNPVDISEGDFDLRVWLKRMGRAGQKMERSKCVPKEIPERFSLNTRTFGVKNTPESGRANTKPMVGKVLDPSLRHRRRDEWPR